MIIPTPKNSGFFKKISLVFKAISPLNLIGGKKWKLVGKSGEKLDLSPG